jgi:hypothetical protein
MKTINQKYQTNGALLVGPVVEVGKIETGETLGVTEANRSKFIALNQSFRVRRHSDGWFVDGSRHKSQIWEYGNGLLGLTVTGIPLLRRSKSASSWLIAKQIGHDEGNFYCLWNDENLARLTKLAGIQRRRKPKDAN